MLKCPKCKSKNNFYRLTDMILNYSLINSHKNMLSSFAMSKKQSTSIDIVICANCGFEGNITNFEKQKNK